MLELKSYIYDLLSGKSPPGEVLAALEGIDLRSLPASLRTRVCVCVENARAEARARAGADDEGDAAPAPVNPRAVRGDEEAGFSVDFEAKRVYAPSEHAATTSQLDTHARVGGRAPGFPAMAAGSAPAAASAGGAASRAAPARRGLADASTASAPKAGHAGRGLAGMMSALESRARELGDSARTWETAEQAAFGGKTGMGAVDRARDVERQRQRWIAGGGRDDETAPDRDEGEAHGINNSGVRAAWDRGVERRAKEYLEEVEHEMRRGTRSMRQQRAEAGEQAVAMSDAQALILEALGEPPGAQRDAVGAAEPMSENDDDYGPPIPATRVVEQVHGRPRTCTASAAWPHCVIPDVGVEDDEDHNADDFWDAHFHTRELEASLDDIASGDPARARRALEEAYDHAKSSQQRSMKLVDMLLAGEYEAVLKDALGPSVCITADGRIAEREPARSVPTADTVAPIAPRAEAKEPPPTKQAAPTFNVEETDDYTAVPPPASLYGAPRAAPEAAAGRKRGRTPVHVAPGLPEQWAQNVDPYAAWTGGAQPWPMWAYAYHQ